MMEIKKEMYVTYKSDKPEAAGRVFKVIAGDYTIFTIQNIKTKGTFNTQVDKLLPYWLQKGDRLTIEILGAHTLYEVKRLGVDEKFGQKIYYAQFWNVYANRDEMYDLGGLEKLVKLVIDGPTV